MCSLALRVAVEAPLKSEMKVGPGGEKKGRAIQAALGERERSPPHECCGNNLCVCVGRGVTSSLIIQIIPTQCGIFGKKQGGKVTDNRIF